MPPESPVHSTKATKHTHRLILIGAPLLFSALLLGGYAWHQLQLEQRQRQMMAETSVRLQEILITEQGLTESVMEMPAGMTYDESFRACDRSIDERNRLVVAIRLLPPTVLRPLRERIMSHMKAMNELTRAKANLMHLVVRWHSKLRNHSDDFSRLEAEFLRTQAGGELGAIEWALRQSIVEIKALAKEMSDSANAFEGMYDRLSEEEEGISAEARQAGIIFESGLKKFAPANKALSASARRMAK